MTAQSPNHVSQDIPRLPNPNFTGFPNNPFVAPNMRFQGYPPRYNSFKGDLGCPTYVPQRNQQILQQRTQQQFTPDMSQHVNNTVSMNKNVSAKTSNFPADQVYKSFVEELKKIEGTKTEILEKARILLKNLCDKMPNYRNEIKTCLVNAMAEVYPSSRVQDAIHALSPAIQSRDAMIPNIVHQTLGPSGGLMGPGPGTSQGAVGLVPAPPPLQRFPGPPFMQQQVLQQRHPQQPLQSLQSLQGMQQMNPHFTVTQTQQQQQMFTQNTSLQQVQVRACKKF